MIFYAIIHDLVNYNKYLTWWKILKTGAKVEKKYLTLFKLKKKTLQRAQNSIEKRN